MSLPCPKELNLDTSESRRTLFQLKCVSSQVVLHPFDYFERNMYSGLRNSHSKKLALKFARVDVVKNSFSFSIAPIWNSLPQSLIEQTNSDIFLIYGEHISQRNNVVLYHLYRPLRR